MSKHFQVTLGEQIGAFLSEGKIIGDYEHCHGFYDWFCKDYALEDKAKKLMPKVIKFVKAQNLGVNLESVGLFKQGISCFITSIH